MLTRVGVRIETTLDPENPESSRPTLICFSHLRWDFVFQRPQHLMSRFAKAMPVMFWEEPVEVGRKETAFLKVREALDAPGVRVVTPHLPEGLSEADRDSTLTRLLAAFAAGRPGPLITWYYTPM